MKSQFARLYILIILITTLVIFSFSEIYSSFFQAHTSYQVDISQLMPLEHENFESQVKLVEVDPKSIALPEELNLILNKGQVIKLGDGQGKEFYYRLSSNRGLYQYGPFESPSVQRNDNEFYFVLLFYSALALMILTFIWPLFRDLDTLQAKALVFGNKLQPIKSDIPTSSSIHPLANTFDKMSHQIVETMQMHQDLSRTIAHEIRTPLSRMKFVTELISENISEQHQHRLKTDVEEIQLLMVEYLSFERLEHEHCSMEKKQVDVVGFIQELKEKYTYQQSDIMINFESKVNQAYFNEKSMTRALENLINNALCHARTVIHVSFEILENQCVVIVTDDGSGVGKEAKKLIQPFIRQAEKGELDKGFGLGLYIVRKILIWHQGNLTLDNCALLHGARVRLTWPNEA